MPADMGFNPMLGEVTPAPGEGALGTVMASQEDTTQGLRALSGWITEPEASGDVNRVCEGCMWACT